MPPHHLSAGLLSSPGPPSPTSVRLLLSLLPATVLVPAVSTVVAVALPVIIEDLGMGASAITWLVTGYLLVTALFQAPAGELGDRVGHRRVLLVGVALLAIASAAAAVAPDAPTLVIARLLQGVAGAAIVPPGLALIRRRLVADQRRRAVGRFLAALTAGALLGVAAGGVVIAAAGWRAAFVGVAVLAGVVLVPTAFVPGSSGPPAGREPTLRTDRTWRGGRALLGPAAGIALTNLALYVVIVVVPLRLDELGWSPAVSGASLGVFVAASAAGTIAASSLSSAIGHARAVAAGAGGAGTALTMLAAVPTSLPSLLPGLVAAGLGLGVAMAALYTDGLGAGRRETAGSTAGLLSTARYGGSILGTGALPLVLTATGHVGGLGLAAVGALVVVPVAARRGRDRTLPSRTTVGGVPPPDGTTGVPSERDRSDR